MKRDPNWKPPKQKFLKLIYNRTHFYKKNFLMAITGETGAGKSYTALTMAEKLDPRFTIDSVCFSAKEFLKKVQDIKYNGQVLIFDDAGAMGIGNRKWYTETNILTNYVIQTFRYKHGIVFFCVPDFSLIDVGTRKMIQCMGLVTRIGNVAKLRPYSIVADRKRGDLYYMYYRFNNGHGVEILREVPLSMPSTKLRKQYEEKHKIEKEKLLKNAYKTLDAIERESVVKTESLDDDLKYIKSRPEEFKTRKGTWDAILIQGKMGLTQRRALLLKRLIEKSVSPDVG